MKAFAFGLASVGSIAVLLQWAFVVDQWTFLSGKRRCRKRLVLLNANSPQSKGRLKSRATQQHELPDIEEMTGSRCGSARTYSDE